MYRYTAASTGGLLQFFVAEPELKRNYFTDVDEKLLTIAWNRGPAQSVWVDEVEHRLDRDDLILLIVSHSYRFAEPECITAWRFNREFYCIVDHDKEVSCAGFLFYGLPSPMRLRPPTDVVRKLDLLNQVFIDEFETHDTIQGEMLRMLLKRLIIMLTRLGKEQHLKDDLAEPEYDSVREFNLLVEKNYRRLHKVSDYAALMFKSPKTLSNLFRKAGQASPLHIIRDRIALEGKRLLIYTDKTVAEIADDLGFDEPAHFSRFFKSVTQVAPTELRRQQTTVRREK